MPRLKKGELAPGIEKRSQEARQQVSLRLSFFTKARQKGSPLPDVEKFLTVDALCVWTDPDLCISPISAKTLRRHLASMYPSGLAGLLDDAKALLKSIADDDDDPSTDPRIRKLVAERTQMATDSTLAMTMRYADLLARLRRLADTHVSAREELDSHFRKYGEFVSHLRRVE